MAHARSIPALFLIITLAWTPPSAGQTKGDSLAADRQRWIASILDSLRVSDTAPADSVLKNLQVFTASQRLGLRHLLSVMAYWGQSLGVNCDHCHDVSRWSSDEKRPKEIARSMYRMRGTINNEILAKIPDLRSKPARVNCMTCHDGQVLPR